ncbi:hypothetical protein RSAG8_00322, partial [Rhizoctonia solani AG-8 WAC10335]
MSRFCVLRRDGTASDRHQVGKMYAAVNTSLRFEMDTTLAAMRCTCK